MGRRENSKHLCLDSNIAAGKVYRLFDSNFVYRLRNDYQEQEEKRMNISNKPEDLSVIETLTIKNTKLQTDNKDLKNEIARLESMVSVLKTGVEYKDERLKQIRLLT